jgi:thioester reductase-like protein
MIRIITAEINDEGYDLDDEDWEDLLNQVRAILRVNFLKEDYTVKGNR